jgi:hypothetical protein
MTIDRKKPGVAFWASVVVVVLLVAYPLSFGPACWWFATPGSQLPSSDPEMNHAPRLYWPIGWLAQHGPERVADAIFWYAKLRNRVIALPVDPAGSDWYDSRLHSLIKATVCGSRPFAEP